MHTTKDGLSGAVVLTHSTVYENTAKNGLGSAVVLPPIPVYVNNAKDRLCSAVVLIFMALFTCTLRMMHYAVQ